MIRPRQYPWVSLLLLLGCYAIVGRVMATLHDGRAVWGFVGLGGLAVAALYMHPLTDMRRFMTRWFSSDTVAFCILVGLAAFTSILLHWFKAFLPVILVLAAEALARLDLQAAKFTELQSFVILVLTTALGLFVGWGLWILIPTS
jgi:hypothetical protein